MRLRGRKESPPDVRSTVHDASADARDRPGLQEIPYLRRFNVVTFALFGLAAVALVSTAFVIDQARDDRVRTVDLTWSDWRPESDGPDQGSREIADHVARDYRLASGEQLVAVTGSPIEFSGLPANLALRQSAADGGDINLLPGNGALYRMCGLGPNCSLDKGTPSVARHLVLRREALELALFSFRYLDKDDVENVVVLMPPPAKPDDAQQRGAGESPPTAEEQLQAATTQALYFPREELAEKVSKPLRLTLPKPAPTPSTVRRSRNALLVDRLTNPLQFQASITQANTESTVFLVLDPLRTQPALLGGRTNGAPLAGNGASTEPDVTGSLNTPLTPKPAAPAGPRRSLNK